MEENTKPLANKKMDANSSMPMKGHNRDVDLVPCHDEREEDKKAI
jgi:hypothetical protein